MVAGIATVAILGRALGPEVYGVLGFGSAILAIMGIVTTLGTDAYGARAIAQNPASARSVVGSLVLFRLAMAFVAYLALIALISFLERSELEKTVLMVQGAGVFVAAIGLDFLFQGLQRMGAVAFRQICTALAILAFVAIFVGQPDHVLRAAWIYLLTGFAAGAVIFGFAHKMSGPFTVWRTSAEWRVATVAIVPMAISTASHTIMFHTDVMMLGLLRESAEVGLYTASVRVALTAMAPSGLVIAAFFPVLSSVFEDRDQWGVRSRQFCVAALAVGMPLSAVILINPHQALGVLFGSEFSAGSAALVVLMASALVAHVRIGFEIPLAAWKCERLIMWTYVGSAALNVVLNLLLIGPYGMLGAAVASLACQVVAALALAVVLKSKFDIILVTQIVRVLACIGAAAVATWLIQNQIDYAHFADRAIFEIVSGGLIFATVFAPIAYLWLFRRAGLKVSSASED